MATCILSLKNINIKTHNITQYESRYSDSNLLSETFAVPWPFYML